jgi:phosphoglycolate phosphatase-like HAD superfamily hydrolase
MIAALIWDVDGTMAETERDGHRVAFNLAFEALGLAWRWDEEHYCRRRSKSEPPCRPNIEPGVEADFELVGCG